VSSNGRGGGREGGGKGNRTENDETGGGDVRVHLDAFGLDDEDEEDRDDCERREFRPDPRDLVVVLDGVGHHADVGNGGREDHGERRDHHGPLADWDVASWDDVAELLAVLHASGAVELDLCESGGLVEEEETVGCDVSRDEGDDGSEVETYLGERLVESEPSDADRGLEDDDCGLPVAELHLLAALLVGEVGRGGEFERSVLADLCLEGGVDWINSRFRGRLRRRVGSELGEIGSEC